MAWARRLRHHRDALRPPVGAAPRAQPAAETFLSEPVLSERAKGLVGPAAGVATFFVAPLRAARFVWGVARVGVLGAGGASAAVIALGQDPEEDSASGSANQGQITLGPLP